jgi:predicted SAM-dependent methyltransferase
MECGQHADVWGPGLEHRLHGRARVISLGLRRAFRHLRTEIQVQRRHRTAVKHARRLATQAPLRLNLGSLGLDLREPLPFADNSAEAISVEHFECLNYVGLTDSKAWELETAGSPSEALSLLRECRRVLAPDGLLEIVVPDAEAIVSKYAARHEEPFPKYSWCPAWCDTPAHCVNYLFRQGRVRRYAYDQETLSRVLQSAGFAAVDAPNHAAGFVCMRARKPQKTLEADPYARVA